MLVFLCSFGLKNPALDLYLCMLALNEYIYHKQNTESTILANFGVSVEFQIVCMMILIAFWEEFAAVAAANAAVTATVFVFNDNDPVWIVVNLPSSWHNMN